MRTALVAAGANIALIAGLATLYGILASSQQIVGVGLSGVITGLALIGAGSTPREGAREPLIEAVRIFLNSHAGILESIGLLPHEIHILPGDPPLLVIAGSSTTPRVDPGIGVKSGSIYLAIPLRNVLDNLPPLGEPTEAALRNIFSDLLTSEYRVASITDIEFEGDQVRATLLGVSEEFRSLQGYPLDPLVLLVLVLLFRLTGKGVRLIEYNHVGGGLEVRVRMRG